MMLTPLGSRRSSLRRLCSPSVLEETVIAAMVLDCRQRTLSGAQKAKKWDTFQAARNLVRLLAQHLPSWRDFLKPENGTGFGKVNYSL